MKLIQIPVFSLIKRWFRTGIGVGILGFGLRNKISVCFINYSRGIIDQKERKQYDQRNCNK